MSTDDRNQMTDKSKQEQCENRKYIASHLLRPPPFNSSHPTILLSPPPHSLDAVIRPDLTHSPVTPIRQAAMPHSTPIHQDLFDSKVSFDISILRAKSHSAGTTPIRLMSHSTNTHH
ncbi:hypothetical protein E3N88_15857 [Mikania micrantha]|uniref:Uncharacterized protein n=1 Tax=Mikania micrantha TaxID=192012 RepID=A0A5N6NXY9_9ASTR|nr:hypothetical protein E3N88_15857 [Mikania micrantha]